MGLAQRLQSGPRRSVGGVVSGFLRIARCLLAAPSTRSAQLKRGLQGPASLVHACPSGLVNSLREKNPEAPEAHNL